MRIPSKCIRLAIVDTRLRTPKLVPRAHIGLKKYNAAEELIMRCRTVAQRIKLNASSHQMRRSLSMTTKEFLKFAKCRRPKFPAYIVAGRPPKLDSFVESLESKIWTKRCDGGI